MNYNTSLVLSLLIVRLFIQIFIYYKGMSKLRETDLIGWAPIFEICLLMVNFYVFIYSRFSHSDKWK